MRFGWVPSDPERARRQVSICAWRRCCLWAVLAEIAECLPDVLARVGIQIIGPLRGRLPAQPRVAGERIPEQRLPEIAQFTSSPARRRLREVEGRVRRE